MLRRNILAVMEIAVLFRKIRAAGHRAY